MVISQPQRYNTFRTQLLHTTRVQRTGGLPSLKLSLHSCSLLGSTNAMGIETSIALVLLAREHECDTSFVLGRPPALSHYAVDSTDTFKEVNSRIDRDLLLSPGCCKLTYRHPLFGKVLLETDHDWHFAVEFSRARGRLIKLQFQFPLQRKQFFRQRFPNR
ncbi:hypothetical protein Tco_1019902 [Tanacetum coccineum]|uniref:Uncharacterized protein n=1 Tax=Tanacetum coccineum TaxID=301880 RepID=A0ABQ5G0R3_9ASTR